MDEQNQAKVIRYGVIAIVIAIVLGIGSGILNLYLSQEDEESSRIPFGQSEFPDLVVQNIDGPEELTVGDTGTYTVEVRNLKCCRSGDFVAVVTLNGEEIERRSLASLLNDESTTFTVDVTFETAGNAALIVEIESRSETNFDNNLGVMPVTVTD